MKHYNDTDQRLHLLCQKIAKVNRTFVPSKEDDSHTNLYFDPVGDRILGRWIELKDRKLLFMLNLSNMKFEVVNDSQELLASYAIINRINQDIELEVEAELPSLGLHGSGFREKLHFEIPDYPFAEEQNSSFDLAAINEWKAYRSLSNEACALFLGHAQCHEEIRIWPHHFDTGVYTDVKPNLGLGFGFAMQDEMVGAPYFYLVGYPAQGAIDFNGMPEGIDWEWKTGEEWNGAVFPISHLANKTDEERKVLLRDYIKNAFGWFVLQR